MNAHRKGLIAGIAAYLLWGLFPIYWRSLSPSTPVELLAHRVIWAFVCVGVILLVVRRFGEVREALGTWRRFLVMLAASVAIAINWGLFIWGVNNGHTVEVSLGYFVMPLVIVLFGVIFVGERLRPAQWVAMAIAAVAVIVQTIEVGRFPWLGLSLAMSFGTYSLLKKLSPTPAVTGLFVETLVLLPAALAVWGWFILSGQATFGQYGAAHTLQVIGVGAVTFVPLLLFTIATQSIPLTTVGLLQYINPTIQLFIGVFLFHEPMPAMRWLGFVIVWCALVIFSIDAVRHNRRQRRGELADIAQASAAS